MRKILSTSILILFFHVVYSQNNKDMIVKKIKAFIEANAVSSTPNKPYGKVIIYFNNVDKILDIDDFQIPLLEVKTAYALQLEKNTVNFSCKNGSNCIVSPNGDYTIAFGIPFKTKKDCYDLIALIDELKK